MTTKQHLAVLNKTHEEQLKWCVDNAGLDIVGESLADLAFRLRDEVKDLPNFAWSKAWHLVVAKVRYNYDWGDEELEKNWQEWTGSNDAVPDTPDREIFALYDSKPIHWIIAALIAKGEK